MKYVQRNEAGAVIGVYDAPQLGQEAQKDADGNAVLKDGEPVMITVDYAPEQLADDHPDVVAWLDGQLQPKVYVQRDDGGKIVGRYSQPQEGLATEALHADDPALRPMDEVYAAKVAEINEAFEVSAAQLTAGYPPSEKITWPTQQDEALAWRASDLNPTPYIDALAAARGIGRVDFLGRVLLKVDAFRAASALIVGTRQRYVDVASAARDKGDVRAIDAIRPMFKLS